MFQPSTSKETGWDPALKQRLLVTMPGSPSPIRVPNPNRVPLLETEPPVVDRRGRRHLSTRAWIRIDKHGSVQMLEVDKVYIMRRCELPARDLRLLDPVFVYPTTILGREKAIVVNLEQIRCIITAEEVFLLNTSANKHRVEGLVREYMEELRARIRPEQQNGVASEKLSAAETHHHGLGLLSDSHHLPQGAAMVVMPDGDTAAIPPSDRNCESDMFSGGGVVDDLPFEFRALEAALEVACRHLDHEVSGLERSVHSTLKALTANINTLNLEKVRRLKSELVGITARAKKVRDEIEQLMNDDDDMAEMYLTEKQERAEAMGLSTPHSTAEFGSAASERYSDISQTTPAASATSNLSPRSLLSSSLPGSVSLLNNAQPPGSPTKSGSPTIAKPGSPTRLQNMFSFTSKKSNLSEPVESIDELEMLLEAYFVFSDRTYGKILTLKEYIDDTEDYMHIQLDHTRNQLMQFEVLLTTATFVVGIYGVVAGVFGMNIEIKMYHEPWTLKWVLLITMLTGVLIYAGITRYLYNKKLLPI